MSPFEEPEFKSAVERVVAGYMDSSASPRPQLFEKCTDVSVAVYKRLSAAFKQRFDVYIVMGIWDMQQTSERFREKYLRKYPGQLLPASATHQWLAVCPHSATDLTMQPHHEFDPTYCQFLDEDWTYDGCTKVYAGRSYERIVRADRVY